MIMATMSENPTTEAGAEAERAAVHEIHAKEAHRKYKLIALDDTEMERTASELFAGSRLLQNRDLWIANFRATMKTVRAWVTSIGRRFRWCCWISGTRR